MSGRSERERGADGRRSGSTQRNLAERRSRPHGLTTRLRSFWSRTEGCPGHGEVFLGLGEVSAVWKEKDALSPVAVPTIFWGACFRHVNWVRVY